MKEPKICLADHKLFYSKYEARQNGYKDAIELKKNIYVETDMDTKSRVDLFYRIVHEYQYYIYGHSTDARKDIINIVWRYPYNMEDPDPLTFSTAGSLCFIPKGLFTIVSSPILPVKKVIDILKLEV